MHTLANETTSPAPSSRRAHALPSFDLYGDIHRALRTAMTDLLARMGRTDPGDAREVVARLDDLVGMLDAMASHIAHEATFLHVALERRLPGSAIRLDIEHAEHARAMEDLKELAERVRRADASRRPSSYRALYLRYAAFVGESLVHMTDEETRTQTLFDDLFTTAELHALHDALLASIRGR